MATISAAPSALPALATAAGFLLGYPLAYVMAFRAGRLKNLLLGLVILPFFTTFLVRTFAWKTILGDGGMAVSVLSFLHLLPAEGDSSIPAGRSWAG